MNVNANWSINFYNFLLFFILITLQRSWYNSKGKIYPHGLGL